MDGLPDIARILVLAGLLSPEDSALPLPLALNRLAGAGRLDAARAELADPARFADLTVLSGVPLAEQAAAFERAAASFDSDATLLDAPAAPPQDTGFVPPPGHTLLRPLGEGGMGAVYLVQGPGGRQLALKTFSPAFAAGAGRDAIARFVAEARAAAQLDHPDIIACHKLGILPSGALYYTMPHLEGIDLDELLRRAERPGSEEHARYDLVAKLRLLLRVCRAVGHAHRKGIVHRDLKPSNVMVGREGQVWVVDWGLVGMTNDECRMTNRELPAGGERLTLAGQIMGTLGYMAPEQAEGDLERMGPATDVHALGAMLYEVLAGEPPYTGESSMTSVWKMMHEGAPALPGSPLASIAMKCLAREPGERYPDGVALAGELEDYLEHRPVAAHRYSRHERALLWLQRHPALAAALLLVVLAGGALFGLLHQRRERQRELEARLLQARQAGLARQERDARLQLAAYDVALLELKAALRKATARYLVVYTDPMVALKEAPREPPDPERMLEEKLRSWRVRRSAARALLRQLDRAGHRLPDANGIEARLAGEELEYHAAAAGWVEAATVTSARLHAMATNATPEWQPVLERIEKTPQNPGVKKLLAARGTLVLGALPPGTTGSLSRYDTDPRHTVYPLIHVQALPPAGAALELPIGSYRATIYRKRQAFHFPVLVERPLLPLWHDPHPPARLDFRLPREIPPGFVFCPGGLFLAGGDAPNSLPPCRARVGPFFLARHETTFRDYLRYLKDGAPQDDWPILRYTNNLKPVLNPDGSFAITNLGLTPDHPVFGITLTAVRRYAAWAARRAGRKVRLPSELEWAYAARGADGRTYPWGDRFDASLAGVKGNARRYWAPPGSYQRDLSPLGIHDLGGNVSEWTRTKTPEELWIVRGGNWGTANRAKCAGRLSLAPANRAPGIGFRLVASAPIFDTGCDQVSSRGSCMTQTPKLARPASRHKPSRDDAQSMGRGW